MLNVKDAFWRKRFIVMLCGIIVMGCGISLFKLSLTGNDPSSAMCMAVGDTVGLPFSVTLIIANTLFFIFEICLGRKYIGIATFVNWFGVGTMADLWTKLLTRLFTFSAALVPRLLVMSAGVLILSLACALYQTADLGIAPYDALSIVMDEKLPIPYFWCRIITDSICTIIAFVFGGIIGIGTLVCALGLGPFIQFFTVNAAERILHA